jgi:hypothetical protein
MMRSRRRPFCAATWCPRAPSRPTGRRPCSRRLASSPVTPRRPRAVTARTAAAGAPGAACERARPRAGARARAGASGGGAGRRFRWPAAARRRDSPVPPRTFNPSSASLGAVDAAMYERVHARLPADVPAARWPAPPAVRPAARFLEPLRCYCLCIVAAHQGPGFVALMVPFLFQPGAAMCAASQRLVQEWWHACRALACTLLRGA